jgi:hypothetical protein
MNNVVKVVAHPETGAIFTVGTNNPAWCVMRVDSQAVVMNNGIMDIQKRTAFVRMKTEVSEVLGYKAGQILPGKIVKTESFAPFYENQPAKINPSTGEVVLTQGRPTFIQMTYTMDANAQDTFISEDAEVIAAPVESPAEAAQQL